MARKSKLMAMYSVQSVSSMKTSNYLAFYAMLTAYAWVILQMCVMN